jgi:copper chaperone
MIELKVTGMNCERCVRAVKRALAGVAGVDNADRVDLKSGRALVEGEVDPRALVAAVRAAGYDAELVSG